MAWLELPSRRSAGPFPARLRLLAWLASSVALACGGRTPVGGPGPGVNPSGGGASGEGTGGFGGGGLAAGGGFGGGGVAGSPGGSPGAGGGPGTGGTCGPLPMAPILPVAWVSPLNYTGLGPGLLRFSDSGQVQVTLDEYETTEFVLDALTGMVEASTRHDWALLARDREGRYELRRSAPGGIDVLFVDLETAVGRTQTGHHLETEFAVASDGSYAYLECTPDFSGGGQEMIVGVREPETSVDWVSGTGLPCTTSGNHLAVFPGGKTAIFSVASSPNVYLFDPSLGLVTAPLGHMPYGGTALTRPSYSGTVLTISPSPESTQILTAGAAGDLLHWKSSTFGPALVDARISWWHSFDRCFCEPGSFAPIAWAPSERFVVLPSHADGLQIHRTCDFALAATLSPPIAPPPQVSTEQGPIVAVVDPQERQVAVLYEFGVVSYFLPEGL